MATNVSWNGTSYAVPATGEDNWGGSTKVDGLLIALATHGFNKTGGTFTLSADADFGVSAGLKSIYYKSRGTVSTAGILRMATTEAIGWRNAADSGNNTLATDSSDRLLYNGVILASSAGVVPVASGGTNITSYTIGDMIYASGATTLSKLAIGTANKVMFSSGGTAPAWQLLLDANVDAAAAIARSKLAAGTADHVLINSGAGVMTSEAALSAVRGGTGVANNVASTITISGSFGLTLTLTGITAVTLPTSGTLATLAGTETLSAKTFSDPLTLAHVATPSNPAAGNAKVYVKSDNLLYLLTPAGVEQTVTAAAEKTSAREVTNLSLGASVGGSALTISVFTKAGTSATSTDIVKLGFRNATANTGTYTQVSITAALSAVVSSGSTLGFNSGQVTRLFIYALNNAGTAEICYSTTNKWDTNVVQSTTAEGGAGAADSRSTLYSTTARSNVPITYLGSMDFSLTTAGTWDEVPDVISCGEPATPFLAPTVQTFTSGSGTYTTPAGVKYIRVRLIGGGAGGSCAGTAGGGSPGAGGNTTFGSTIVVGNGASAGGTSGGSPGAGGTASLGAGAVGTAISGGQGGTFGYSVAGYESGEMGASTPFGGGGSGGYVATGGNAPANTGAGGGGGGGGNFANMYGGSGGSAGGFCDAIIAAPAATYAYAVGAGGAGGTLGTNGQAGGVGGSGYIEVTEYYA